MVNHGEWWWWWIPLVHFGILWSVSMSPSFRCFLVDSFIETSTFKAHGLRLAAKGSTAHRQKPSVGFNWGMGQPLLKLVRVHLNSAKPPGPKNDLNWFRFRVSVHFRWSDDPELRSSVKSYRGSTPQIPSDSDPSLGEHPPHIDRAKRRVEAEGSNAQYVKVRTCKP